MNDWSSPHARFNNAPAGPPAAAYPLGPVPHPPAPPPFVPQVPNAATPAVPNGPGVPATPAIPAAPVRGQQPPSAIGAGANPRLNDFQAQMRAWRMSQPQRPDGARGWGRSPEMTTWRDARPQRNPLSQGMGDQMRPRPQGMGDGMRGLPRGPGDVPPTMNPLGSVGTTRR